MRKKAKKLLFKLVGLPLIAALGVGYWLLQPMPTGPTVRLKLGGPMGSVLNDLQSKGIVRNAALLNFASGLSPDRLRLVPSGMYLVNPGMSATEVLRALRNPIKQMVRIPEGRWASRIGKLLQEKEVATASDYVELVKHPEKFKSMGLPVAGETLEGFLYPDTYDMPPTIGAEAAIKVQLRNFAKKTQGLGLTAENSTRILTIASMLELESAKNDERKVISGVIENRLKKGMRLQIDATVNYGMQLWRTLKYSDYTKVKSPYNTYLIKGLPPGPICSPTAGSIEAALQPVKHNYLYYISLPDGRTLFSPTYEEHLKNVKLRDTIKKANASQELKDQVKRK